MPQWDHPFEHFDGHTAPMTIGAEIAASRGMICMNSAGNEGGGTCTLGIPADAEHILTVGAVDANGDRADFSSVGPTYDGRIKPDVMAMGEDTYVAGNPTGSYQYYNGSGTSFSNPVLAGAVACLRQARPYASVQEICDAVRAAGNNVNNPDNYNGYGIPNFVAALEMLGVDEHETASDNIISVFPNPSRGKVTVALKEGLDKTNMTLYDNIGRIIVNTMSVNELEMVLNNLSSGVYTVKADSESGVQTLKVVLTK